MKNIDTIEIMEDSQLIQAKRSEVSRHIGQLSSMLVMVGPCALTNDPRHLDETKMWQEFQAQINSNTNDTGNLKEVKTHEELNDQKNNITILRRLPPWKPRTNPKDWHGEETTNPDGAIDLLRRSNHIATNLGIEIGKPEHLAKYGHMLTFGWTGARNIGNEDLKTMIAQEAETLPFAIKNGLDGDVDGVIAEVEKLQKLRSIDSAPILPLFRGGDKIRTPVLWEEAVIRAIEQTKGQVIIDVAHGGEMAHDPNRKFTKTVQGQIACLEHLIQIITKHSIKPAGIMIETSDVISPTDPNMPIHEARSRIEELSKNL